MRTARLQVPRLGAAWDPYVSAHRESSCCTDLAASAEFIVVKCWDLGEEGMARFDQGDSVQ
jgi:hypothetical protein